MPGGSHGRRAGLFVCVAGLLAGLAGLAAGRLAGRWIEFDIINHFIPQLAILIVASLLGLATPRHRLATAIPVLMIGIIGLGLWPHFVSRQDPAVPAAAAGERIFRVMTFNTRFENPDWQRVADEVVRQNPDIVVLLEVGRSKRPLLEALEPVYPHRADCLREDFCQIVILSKPPFASTETRSDWQGPSMVRVTYGADLGRLALIGAHTTRPPLAARQFEQMQALGDEIAASDGPRLLVGDFNATPFSRMLRTLLERSGLELASGLATWPSTLGLPQIAIDHVMVSPGLRRLGPARIGAPGGSDHYPVIVDFAVPLSD